jgi:hypothetical protein
MDYAALASKESVNKTAENLKPRGFNPIILNTGKEAFEYIKKTIPKGVSVMNGSSVTLEQIGYIEYLKAGEHGWINPKTAILAERDPAKQVELRKHSVVSDYYLGSVHAVTEGGEMVISSNTGSQQPHLVYTSQNLILVVSTKKIVPDLNAAFERIEKHIVQLEEKHMQQLYGVGTQRSKTVILHKESAMAKRKVDMLLVNEDLGF